MGRELSDGAEAIVEYLKDLYDDWTGVVQFEGTEDRLIRMYEELCWPVELINNKVEEYLDSKFEDDYSDMLVTGPSDVWTLCPHHLLPCKYSVIVGYIPEKFVLGLSKFHRIAEAIAMRPIIQEQFTREYSDVLMNGLMAKGVAVYVIGAHDCMASRGIKQKGNVITSAVRGVFYDNPPSRDEFLALARELHNGSR